MPFNPCGFAVQLLREEGTDLIRPFRDSEIEVTRRWYRVPDDAPWLPFPTTFRSTRWEPFPYLREGAGAVWPSEWEYSRAGVILGFDYEHICGNESDFLEGAEFDPAVDQLYDDEWIPLCCGRLSVCVTQLCDQQQVFSRPAMQLWTFPVPHQDATGETPTWLRQFALNQGNGVHNFPGQFQAFHPLGYDYPAVYSREIVADNLGFLQFQEEVWRFTPDTALSQYVESVGPTTTLEVGGVSGSLTLRIVGGVLTLSGVNATVDPDILPPFAPPYTQDWLEATGSTQANAAQLDNGNWVWGSIAPTRGLRLPAQSAARVLLTPYSSTTAALLYPPLGEAFQGESDNAPIAIGPGTDYAGQLLLTRYEEAVLGTPVIYWRVALLLDSPPAEGTVTSIAATSATSTLGVVVTNPTTTPSITITPDVALDDLVLLATVDELILGDGAGGLRSLALGDYLEEDSGQINVLPPTATSAQTVCAPFACTGTSGTYQASGNTIALPAAGTYLVTCKLRSVIRPGAAGAHQLLARLRNVTAGADIANSETMLAQSEASGAFAGGTSGFTAVVTVAGATTLELYIARTGTSWTTSLLASDSTGYSVIDAVRLS